MEAKSSSSRVTIRCAEKQHETLQWNLEFDDRSRYWATSNIKGMPFFLTSIPTSICLSGQTREQNVMLFLMIYKSYMKGSLLSLHYVNALSICNA